MSFAADGVETDAQRPDDQLCEEGQSPDDSLGETMQNHHDRSELKTRIADMFTSVSVLPMRNQSGNPKENK